MTRIRAQRDGSQVLFWKAGTGRDLKVKFPRPTSLQAVAQVYATTISALRQANPSLGSRTSMINLGHELVIPKTRYEFKKNPSRRFLVPEIEVAGCRTSRGPVEEILYTWGGQIVHDGSLPSTGFEINLQPAQGDLYIKMIEEVCEALREGGAYVDGSCGLHVHVDARDFQYPDIRRLVFLYELLEPAIFSLLPPARRSNRFCVPCAKGYAEALRAGKPLKVEGGGRRKFNKEPLIELVYGKRAERGANGILDRGSKYGRGATHDARYRGLNLYSWFYRGSVEFRHLFGTINPGEIVAWSMICGEILNQSLKLSEKEITELRPSGWDSLAKESQLRRSTKILLETCAPTTECKEFVKNYQKTWKEHDTARATATTTNNSSATRWTVSGGRAAGRNITVNVPTFNSTPGYMVVNSDLELESVDDDE